jgi:hypothetical protein
MGITIRFCGKEKGKEKGESKKDVQDFGVRR